VANVLTGRFTQITPAKSLEIDHISVNTTSGTLANANYLNTALQTDLIRLNLIPDADAGVIYWNNGTASASSGIVPAGGVSIDVLKDAADEIELYAAAAAGLTVVQETI